MKNVIYKILFKIFNKINKFKIIVRIKYYESVTNQKINYVAQGEGGLVLSGDVAKFRIAETSHLKSGTFIECSGGVVIGDYFHTGRGLTIFSTNHNYKSEKYIPYDNVSIERKVIIGNAVWIGANVTIAPGVSIGNGVIVSSGSVVFGDIPDCAIIRGNPAEIIKYRDKEIFYSLYSAGNFQ